MKFTPHTSDQPRRDGFLGWQGQVPNGEQNLAAMQAALNTRLPLEGQTEAGLGIASTRGLHQHSERITATLIGEPSWQHPELQALAKQETPAAALAEAYRRWGEQLTDYISGPFALLVIDAHKQRLLAATDKLARYPIYFTQFNGGAAIAANADTLLACHGVEKQIDPQGIYNYVYFHMVPAPGSVYRNIHKLQAAQRLVIENQQLRCQRYWQPEFSETAPASQEDQQQQLRDILQRAVKRADAPALKTGAFLSGGLDSSTVSGYLADNPKAKAYSIGFSAEGYDEMPYARISAKHFGIDLVEYYVTPEDVVNNLPTIAASYDEPFGNSSALPAYFCAQRAASDGVERLLAGDGGDELFAGNERYAKQRLFEAYQAVPGALRKNAIEPLVAMLPNALPLASKSKSYIEQANTPLPDRLQSYNFLHRHQPGEIFAADFIGSASEDVPLALLRNLYQQPKDATSLNRMLFTDWQITLADNDLRKVSGMCSLAGIDVAYPMLDDELLEFSCQVPSQHKLKGSDLRRFYKQALTGWLPDDTINKSKQGFGLPFGVWMATHKPLQEMAYDTLANLKKRDYFSASFLDQAIELHRSGHSAYYGELIWILCVLEMWLERR